MSVTHLYPKGQSGNPGGLTSEHARMAKEFRYKCAREADKRLPVILEIIDNPETPPHVRSTTLFALMDRGYGKAVQHLLIDEDKDSKRPEMMTKAELDSYLAGDAMATFKSMVQRGEPVLLETIRNLTHPIAQDNPSYGSNNSEKINNDISGTISSALANECDTNTDSGPDRKNK